MRATVFLQNAWSEVYAGEQWPRESWLEALHRSRSGQRLRVMRQAGGPSIEWWYDNTTAEVADTPSGICPPDREHIERVLIATNPDVIVTCGKQAEKALIDVCGLLLLRGPLLAVPHPAYRFLTDALYATAGERIRDGLAYGVHVMRQERKP